MITAIDMERIGLDNLLNYLEMSKDELCSFMIQEGLYTIEELAKYLSEDSDICIYCGNNYVFIENEPICDDCLYYLKSHKNWR